MRYGQQFLMMSEKGSVFAANRPTRWSDGSLDSNDLAIVDQRSTFAHSDLVSTAILVADVLCISHQSRQVNLRQVDDVQHRKRSRWQRQSRQLQDRCDTTNYTRHLTPVGLGIALIKIESSLMTPSVCKVGVAGVEVFVHSLPSSVVMYTTGVGVAAAVAAMADE